MKKIIILIIGICFFIPNYNAEEIQVTFSKCIDGDTAEFIYQEEKLKTRFLAIDTPETVHPKKKAEPFGKEASNYTCDKIKNAKEIILEFDDNSEKKDKYDRYLAWIFVDNSLLQKELIAKGFAKVDYLYGDYKYTEELQKEEKQAKKEQVGIWGNYQEEKDYSWIIFIILATLVLLPALKKSKS